MKTISLFFLFFSLSLFPNSEFNSCEEKSNVTLNITFNVTKIKDFSLIQGNYNWIANSKTDLLFSTIKFYNNGKCQMYIAGHTLTGTYSTKNDISTISVRYSGRDGLYMKVTGIFLLQSKVGTIHYLSERKYAADVAGMKFRNVVGKEYTSNIAYSFSLGF